VKEVTEIVRARLQFESLFEISAEPALPQRGDGIVTVWRLCIIDHRTPERRGREEREKREEREEPIWKKTGL